MDPQASFVLAQVADRAHLFALKEVREIVPAMALSNTDRVQGRCRGIANVRGEVVPVFDLEGRQGMLDPAQLIIIARGRDGSPIGILVDDVLEILHVHPSHVICHPVGRGRSARSINLRGTPVAVIAPAEVADAA